MFLALLIGLEIKSAHAGHKIIYMISPPRSLSVAFLRMMEARKDFVVMHEPSQRTFCLKHVPILAKEWFLSDAPATYAEVKQQIFEKSKTSNVFVKEMSFAVEDLLLYDFELAKNPDVYFIFLVRNPHHSILSFYKRTDQTDDQFSFLIGYEAQYKLFERLRQTSVNPVFILRSEDLYERPREVIQSFCKAMDIPFLEHSLRWDDLGEDFKGQKEWSEIKPQQLTHHWHSDAIRSQGFGRPSDYAVDENGVPTFVEVQNEADRKTCQEAYLENNLAYQKLLSHQALILR